MRTLALVAIIGAGFSLGGVAAARPWTDPAGRLTIDVPASWVVSSERTDGFSYVVAGNANNECHFLSVPNTSSASARVDTVRRTILNDAQFDEAAWLRMANAISTLFPNNSASFVSRSRDDSGAWPVQRAELQSPERPVHAGLQLRPGFDVSGYCLTYGGADPIAVYDGVLRTMGHPNDAEFLALGAQQEAERAAATAAPPAPPPPAADGERRRRNN